MKKKVIIIFAILFFLLLAGGSAYLLINKENSYNYTIEEEKWIEQNKNNIIDIYMPSDIAGLTLSGEGVFFDFLESFNKNTGLKLNPSAYQLGEEVNGNYSILLVDKVTDDDITLLKDEYVIITKNIELNDNQSDLSQMKIGVLKSEGELIPEYLGTNLQYVPYDSKELLLAALSTDEITCIVGLKTVYLQDILNNNYHIFYHISDLTKTYVLRTNSNNEELNSIMKKEYAKFEKKDLNKSYNSNLLSIYVKLLNISEQDLANLNSKTYTYGYIYNGVYDNTYRRSLSGTNYFIIKSFASFANIDMKYSDEFNSLEELNNSLSTGKIDFYFDNTVFNIENTDNKTVLPIKSKIVFLVKNDKKISINSLRSLTDREVIVLENSQLQKYLSDNDINVKTYKNYNDMFKNKNLNKSDIIAIELDNYEYYKTRGLNNYHISYILEDTLDYGFVVSNNNEMFLKLLNFYLEYIDINSIIDINYVNVYEYEGLNIFLLIAVIILLFIIFIQFLGKIKKAFVAILKRKNKTLTKEQKMKYIDSLTSLKNRTYLNDNIEKWDNSEIYPQIIIVVDLNNISYINDNFGHEEGDKVIAQAASILIQTQMPNTDIIRTDGNEFLIYMVDYEEKKAVSYIRKLNREFKNLTHGYGAAIGYSIINDAIKTIDDAVNEATLDMKTNKEIMNEESK